MADHILAHSEGIPQPFVTSNAGADFETTMRLAFVAGQRSAHYGPSASKAFAAFLAKRLVNRHLRSRDQEAKSG